MKPAILFVVIFATVLSACAGGRTTPTAPSDQSNPTTQTPPIQPSGPLEIGMAVVHGRAVDQPVTFMASASSSANATLDFGDGDQVAFDLARSATTLKHVYERAGTFIATLTATTPAGISASIHTTVVVG